MLEETGGNLRRLPAVVLVKKDRGLEMGGALDCATRKPSGFSEAVFDWRDRELS